MSKEIFVINTLYPALLIYIILHFVSTDTVKLYMSLQYHIGNDFMSSALEPLSLCTFVPSRRSRKSNLSPILRLLSILIFLSSAYQKNLIFVLIL